MLAGFSFNSQFAGEFAPAAQPVFRQLVQVHAGAEKDGDQQHAVEADAQEVAGQQMFPFALLGSGSLAGLLLGRVDACQDPGRKFAPQPGQRGIRGFDHIRRRESGDDRHGDDDGIDESAHDPQAAAHAGDDESELAELRHRESGMDGRIQSLAGE